MFLPLGHRPLFSDATRRFPAFAPRRQLASGVLAAAILAAVLGCESTPAEPLSSPAPQPKPSADAKPSAPVQPGAQTSGGDPARGSFPLAQALDGLPTQGKITA